MGGIALVLGPRAVDMLCVNGKVARRAAIDHHELCEANRLGMKAQIV